jgi:RNA polymerase sigma-70 factor (ECF subfamily)
MERQTLEASIRGAWDARDFETATTATLRGYGPEVLGFLVATLKDANAAEEAFSLFAERLWLNMARFEWKCSVRTWSYVIARHAAADRSKNEARHHRARVTSSSLAELEASVRTETLSILRTQKRTEVAMLRDELGDEDRALLVLRVDRNLSWRDIAQVMGGAPEGELDREAARLRKRFQLVKEQLRKLAKERGLL